MQLIRKELQKAIAIVLVAMMIVMLLPMTCLSALGEKFNAFALQKEAISGFNIQIPLNVGGLTYNQVRELITFDNEHLELVDVLGKLKESDELDDGPIGGANVIDKDNQYCWYLVIKADDKSIFTYDYDEDFGYTYNGTITVNGKAREYGPVYAVEDYTEWSTACPAESDSASTIVIQVEFSVESGDPIVFGNAGTISSLSVTIPTELVNLGFDQLKSLVTTDNEHAQCIGAAVMENDSDPYWGGNHIIEEGSKYYCWMLFFEANEGYCFSSSIAATLNKKSVPGYAIGFANDMTVEDGTFSYTPSENETSQYFAIGLFFSTEADDYQFIITSADVAQIGSDKYTSLENAFAAAKDGDEIVLINDAYVSEAIKFTFSDITLDLNGHGVYPSADYVYENNSGLIMADISALEKLDVNYSSYNFTIDGTKEGSLIYGGRVPAGVESWKVVSAANLSINGGRYFYDEPDEESQWTRVLNAECNADIFNADIRGEVEVYCAGEIGKSIIKGTQIYTYDMSPFDYCAFVDCDLKTTGSEDSVYSTYYCTFKGTSVENLVIDGYREDFTVTISDGSFGDIEVYDSSVKLNIEGGYFYGNIEQNAQDLITLGGGKFTEYAYEQVTKERWSNVELTIKNFASDEEDFGFHKLENCEDGYPYYVGYAPEVRVSDDFYFTFTNETATLVVGEEFAKDVLSVEIIDVCGDENGWTDFEGMTFKYRDADERPYGDIYTVYLNIQVDQDESYDKVLRLNAKTVNALCSVDTTALENVLADYDKFCESEFYDSIEEYNDENAELVVRIADPVALEEESFSSGVYFRRSLLENLVNTSEEAYELYWKAVDFCSADGECEPVLQADIDESVAALSKAMQDLFDGILILCLYDYVGPSMYCISESTWIDSLKLYRSTLPGIYTSKDQCDALTEITSADEGTFLDKSGVYTFFYEYGWGPYHNEDVSYFISYTNDYDSEEGKPKASALDIVKKQFSSLGEGAQSVEDVFDAVIKDIDAKAHPETPVGPAPHGDVPAPAPAPDFSTYVDLKFNNGSFSWSAKGGAEILSMSYAYGVSEQDKASAEYYHIAPGSSSVAAVNNGAHLFKAIVKVGNDYKTYYGSGIASGCNTPGVVVYSNAIGIYPRGAYDDLKFIAYADNGAEWAKARNNHILYVPILEDGVTLDVTPFSENNYVQFCFGYKDGSIEVVNANLSGIVVVE